MTDLDEALGASPFVRFLQPVFELKGDELTAVLPFRQDLVGNPLTPALHGGAISAFLEVTCVAQLFRTQKLERFPKPVDISVDFLRIGRDRDTYARAKVARLGSRVANVRAEAWQSDREAPIATLHGHFLLAPKPAPDD